jgi:hypothetical protein
MGKRGVDIYPQGRYFKRTHSGRFHSPAIIGIILKENLRPN